MENDGLRETKSACSSDDSTCADDVLDFMRVSGDFTYTYTGLQIIGIALDGHAIYGPYNSDHELWTCEDHDVCNGHWFSEMDDTYAYITTSTHPYMIGCWGPGPTQVWQHDCSTSVCGGAVQSIGIWVGLSLFSLLALL